MRIRIQVIKITRIHAGPDTDADPDPQHCPSMNLSGADGRDNIVGSLILAGNYAIPEVCVYFSHKLIRGNRTIKVTPLALTAACQRESESQGLQRHVVYG
jgi:hypothetical protein